jgi:hypothetical protein
VQTINDNSMSHFFGGFCGVGGDFGAGSGAAGLILLRMSKVDFDGGAVAFGGGGGVAFWGAGGAEGAGGVGVGVEGGAIG